MKSFKKVLVGIDLYHFNPDLIRYVDNFVRLGTVEEVHYVFVRDRYVVDDLEEETQLELSDFYDSLTDYHLEQRIREVCEKPHRAKFHVLENYSPLFPILKFAKEIDCDLLIIGKRSSGDSSMTESFVRKAPCSTLVVPENASCFVSRVLVPIDFSEYSMEAFEIGAELAVNANLKRLLLAHVYSVPRGYRKVVSSMKQLEKTLETAAEKELEGFLKELNTHDLHIDWNCERGNKPYRSLLDLCASREIDLLVM